MHTSEITQYHKSSSYSLQYANTVRNPLHWVTEFPRGTTFGVINASTHPASRPQQAGDQPSEQLQLWDTQTPGRAGRAHPFRHKESVRERTHLLAEFPEDLSFH